MSEPLKFTDLLLIGKTGNGKSATGNSILGRKVFTSQASSTSVTTSIQIEYSEISGRIVKVVDGPGVCDTNLSERDAFNLVVGAMQFAITANPRGYHAFLLVVPFGGKFTNEDKEAVRMLKAIFGDNFVRQFTIVIVTFGDIFDPVESQVQTFQGWWSKQTGMFRDLITECQDRIILFDNRTREEAKINAQREHLFRIVDSLGERYTDQHFNMAGRERERIQLQTNAPIIREETMMEASLIIQQLGTIQLEEPQQQVDRLENLESRAERLVRSVIDQDRGTNVLKDVLAIATNIKQNVIKQIENTFQAIEIKAQKQQQIDELKAEEDRYKQQQQVEAQMQAESRILQLQNEIKEGEIRYQELVNQIKQNNTVVQQQYQVVARAQNDTIFPMILQAITQFIPYAMRMIFRS